MGEGVRIIYKVLLSLDFTIAKFIWEGFVVINDFFTEDYFLNLYITCGWHVGHSGGSG